MATEKISKDCCVSIYMLDGKHTYLQTTCMAEMHAYVCMYTFFMNILCHTPFLYPNMELDCTLRSTHLFTHSQLVMFLMNSRTYTLEAGSAIMRGGCTHLCNSLTQDIRIILHLHAYIAAWNVPLEAAHNRYVLLQQ